MGGKAGNMFSWLNREIHLFTIRDRAMSEQDMRLEALQAAVKSGAGPHQVREVAEQFLAFLRGQSQQK
jgi:hypothetical protein